MLPTAEQIIEAEQDDELLPQELVNLEADSRLAWIIQNNMVTENGDPLDFYDHPFLVDIYDDDSDDILIAGDMLYITDMIKNQYNYFLNIVHRIEAKNILSTVSQIIDFNEYHMNIFNNYISAYSNIAISEIESANLDKKYNYELKSKDKDIELEKLKLDGKKTELEILKLSKK